MPKFKLNGREVDFEPGEMVIEAAARHGVSIPYYCYHPDLSRPANCRMCLVEMEGAPKPIPSCQWPVNEKMDIKTESPRVQQAQADVMEFLLINHPLDCPICDQAGECKLQQYAYLFGRPASAMLEPKVELDKRKVLGPHVVLDQERCISCTRCVRFLEEVTGTGELTMVERTNHITVDLHPDRQVDNAYSGNIIDMCPVGALTNREFRFSARVWYLQPTDTTCTLCSRACSMTADWRGERRGLPTIKRIRARRNPPVNRSWICDEGRYGYRWIGEPSRPTRARGGAQPAEGGDPFAALDAASGAAGSLLSERSGRSGWLGVLASGAETLEELSALAEVARAADADAALVVPGFEDEAEDEILRRTDKAVNRHGARLLGFGERTDALDGREVLLVADADPRAEGSLAAELVEPLASAATAVVALTAAQRPWAASARVFLPLANAYEKEGTVLAHDGVLQRLARVVPPPGDARPVHHHLAAVAEAAGLSAVTADTAARLRELCADSGPLAGLDPDRLDEWGARRSESGDVEYFEEPGLLFTAAPKSFGEGEYLPFRPTTTPPPAVHVACGSPTAVRLEDPRAGRGGWVPAAEVSRPADRSEEGEDAP